MAEVPVTATVNVTVTLTDMDTILAALGALPLKDAYRLFNDLLNQRNAAVHMMAAASEPENGSS